jgi:antiviral helicase SLH1
VLDQSIRIIQASIDALVEMGYLSSTLQMMTLLQCIKSARWPTDHPLSILPGLDVTALSAYGKGKGKKVEAPATLQDLSRLSQPELGRLASSTQPVSEGRCHGT